MSEPVLFIDRDGALWTITGDGTTAVWNQTHRQWITSRRTSLEIELDHGPLVRIPLPAARQDGQDGQDAINIEDA